MLEQLSWILPVFVTVLLGLLLVIALRAATARPHQYLFSLRDLSPADLPRAVLEGSEQRLARGLSIATVSTSPEGPPPRQELLRYHQHLRDSFPTVFNSPVVTVEIINELSLLFTVAGTDPNLSPYLLLSHMDVVPVKTENWTKPPFAGLIENGNIIGRGAIDVKQTGHAILECLEYRLKTGDLPQRPLIVAFGHDEEVGGRQGAKKIGEVLRRRDTKPLFCLDEGTPILDGLFPGVKKPVAVVSTCEKGYMSVELSATGTAGHSSIPPLDTAVGKLARAVAKLHPNPHSDFFGKGPEAEVIRLLGPVASPLAKLVYTNMWLFEPLLRVVVRRSAFTQAQVTTTTAVTVIEGGFKENVVPGHARAFVNHRVYPLMTKEEVLENDRRAISDPEIKLKVLRFDAPGQTSPSGEKDAPFNMLAGTVQQLYGKDIMTVPALMVGNTDTRHYLDLTRHVFRFDPILMKTNELSRYHGNDEMIAVENYYNCIRFYYQLMKNMETSTATRLMP